MKHLFLNLVVLLLSFSSLLAEDKVGVDEKLDTTIPLDISFLNEKNEKVKLSDLIDKPTVLSLVYFDCPGVCSPLMAGISDVIEKMDLSLGADYQVLTISFNTKDTPEAATEKKKNFVSNFSKKNSKHWIYLTGEQNEIDKITEALGFNYVVEGDDFSHPAVIMMLSPEGKITRYLYGTKFLPFDVKMAIIEAQQGLSRPTVNKILDYCFAYDATQKTYVLQITKIVASITIILLLVFVAFLFIRYRVKKVKIA